MIAGLILSPCAKSAQAAEPYSRNHEVQVPDWPDTPGVRYLRSSGTGMSKTREGAVAKALEEALSKQGTVVSAEIQLSLQAESRRTGSTTVSSSSQNVSTDFSKATGGLIRWWAIEKEAFDGDHHRIEILCLIARTTVAAGTHATRKTIVIAPFRTGSGEAPQNSVERRTAASLTQSLLTQLTASRKFAVLDRTFDEELALVSSQQKDLDPVQRTLVAAQKLGADYVVTGIADNVGMQEQQVGSLSMTTPSGAVMLRVIDAKSRQVVLAVRIAARELEDLHLSGADASSELASALASAMSNRILNTIYPLRIIEVTVANEVIVNRGGEDIVSGAEYDVYNVGEELRDPSSGESLGLSERKVGTIRITQVNPKVSHATVLESSEPITLNAVCRKATLRTKAKPTQQKAKKASSLFD